MLVLKYQNVGFDGVWKHIKFINWCLPSIIEHHHPNVHSDIKENLNQIISTERSRVDAISRVLRGRGCFNPVYGERYPIINRLTNCKELFT